MKSLPKPKNILHKCHLCLLCHLWQIPSLVTPQMGLLKSDQNETYGCTIEKMKTILPEFFQRKSCNLNPVTPSHEHFVQSELWLWVENVVTESSLGRCKQEESLSKSVDADCGISTAVASVASCTMARSTIWIMGLSISSELFWLFSFHSDSNHKDPVACFVHVKAVTLSDFVIFIFIVLLALRLTTYFAGGLGSLS